MVMEIAGHLDKFLGMARMERIRGKEVGTEKKRWLVPQTREGPGSGEAGKAACAVSLAPPGSILVRTPQLPSQLLSLYTRVSPTIQCAPKLISGKHWFCKLPLFLSKPEKMLTGRDEDDTYSTQTSHLHKGPQMSDGRQTR